MSNRHDRRAQKATTPAVPNISGTDANCGNCQFSNSRAAYAKIIAVLADVELKAGRPAPQQMPEDETFCLAHPQHIAKKVWGYCHEHKPKGE